MRVYGFNETETREGTNYYVLLTRSLNSARGTRTFLLSFIKTFLQKTLIMRHLNGSRKVNGYHWHIFQLEHPLNYQKKSDSASPSA